MSSSEEYVQIDDEIDYVIGDFVDSNDIMKESTPLYEAFDAISGSLLDPKSEDFKNLFSMMGLPDASPTAPFSASIFFSFWAKYKSRLSGTEASVAFSEPTEIFETYLQDESKGGSDNNASRINNANIVITYILVRFFNTPTPFSPYAPKVYAKKGSDYYSAYTDVISRLFQISSVRNSKGAGNYKILKSQADSTIKYVSKSPNSGFIKLLCSLSKKQFFTDDPSRNIQDYRTYVSKTPSLGIWCGCFTPLQDSVKSLVSNNPPGSGDLNPECDPLCYNPRALGLYNPYNEISTQGSKKDCLAQVCVIDNVNVKSYSSKGGATFNQICSGCANSLDSDSGCLCFINTSEQTVLSSVGSDQNGGMTNQANFKKNCPNSKCYNMDSNGNATLVECNKENTPATSDVFRTSNNGIAGAINRTNPTNLFWVFVIFISGVLILFFISAIELELKF